MPVARDCLLARAMAVRLRAPLSPQKCSGTGVRWREQANVVRTCRRGADGLQEVKRWCQCQQVVPNLVRACLTGRFACDFLGKPRAAADRGGTGHVAPRPAFLLTNHSTPPHEMRREAFPLIANTADAIEVVERKQRPTSAVQNISSSHASSSPSNDPNKRASQNPMFHRAQCQC